MLDILMPSDNDLDIPCLDVGMQAPVLLPLAAWGSKSRRNAHNGAWHFYVDDYRMASVWRNPEIVVVTGCLAATEPNWTIHDDTPAAVAIHQVYRKRWVARYWQTRGLRVMVDLNVPEKYRELNMYGVPDGWTSFATRGYDRRIEALEAEHSWAIEKSLGKTLSMLVVGGGRKVAEFCRAAAIVHVGYDRAKRVYSCGGKPIPAL